MVDQIQLLLTTLQLMSFYLNHYMKGLVSQYVVHTVPLWNLQASLGKLLELLHLLCPSGSYLPDSIFKLCALKFGCPRDGNHAMDRTKISFQVISFQVTVHINIIVIRTHICVRITMARNIYGTTRV